MSNRIEAIRTHGQSLWYDNIRRGIIDSGELARLIALGITGVTSNPTIFEKAINGSDDYIPAIRRFADQGGTDVNALYDALVLEDIGRGADLLRPVYDSTHGGDGYISIEVPPSMAQETSRTVQEAHRLWDALKRPNIMIKVPATAAGIPAIQQLISEGINVNVTLIFSLKRYRQVIDAYLEGLRARQQKGLPLERIASVASFFVSRVDTLVDALAEKHGLPHELQGKAAVANAKLAYQAYLETFTGEDFRALKDGGAMVQRPLWASTSTKNPAYPDLMYVESLVGPDTVDTLPPATVDAVLDHAEASRTVDQGIDEAKALLANLASHGISMDDVTEQLLQEGVESFRQSFVSLHQSLRRKCAEAVHLTHPPLFSLETAESDWKESLAELDRVRAVPRIFDHDASLWSSEPQHREIIAHALGWLNVIESVQEDLSNLEAYRDEVYSRGIRHIVVLGMGGSSLVSDVLVHSFQSEHPEIKLHVLDTTNPDAIQDLTDILDLSKTLFLVASKSGTTTEPNAFYHYFWDQCEKAHLSAAEHFVAITDPGTKMEAEAKRQHFDRIFLNPADIGGRFSALSWFGMVPAVLYGLDVPELMARAHHMAEACRTPRAEDNPGARLGTALAILRAQGHDKVTFVMPPAVSHLADWLEQLLAESTGKQGTGLIPVAHEPSYDPHQYSKDRLFIVYHLAGTIQEKRAQALQAAGHPVIEITLADVYDLAQEFYRWEFATSVAGSLLQIDAFDQPNVQESKDRTRALLEQYAKTGTLPEEDAGVPDGNLTVVSSQGAGTLDDHLKRLLNHLSQGHYIGLMAYINPTAEHDQRLADLREAITRRTGVATTLGYGPRFLHSTGQLHKGGPATGRYIQIVSQTGPSLPVPGDGYDFLTLEHAQALGDYQSLTSRERPCMRVLVQGPVSEAIQRLIGLVLEPTP